MDKYALERKKLLHSKEALIEAETAINEEVHGFNLEYAELSPLIREILAKVYIRGGLEMYKKVKIELNAIERSNNQKST